MRGVGRYSSGPRIPEEQQLLIPTQLEEIKAATGATDQRIAIGLRQYMKTGQLPGVLQPHEQTLSTLLYLMNGQESRRNMSNQAWAPMTFDLIARGRMTFKEALWQDLPAEDRTKDSLWKRLKVRGGGAFPMSMRDAESSARARSRGDRSR